MTGTELFDKVAEHEELIGLGILETDKGPAVQIKHTPTSMTTQFPLEAIEHLNWEQLESVLTGKREAYVLTHMSRCVGYFSRIGNWHPSKIGELKARIAGTYAISADRTDESRKTAMSVAESYSS